MTLASLQQLASEMGLHRYSGESSPKMLIRAIQKQRGGEPCYLGDKRYNCNEICEWSASCQKLRAVWLR
jgi:hypothetical protein